MAQVALKVIRPVVRLSSRIAPRTVGRAAFHLFCTPFGHARIDEKNPALAKAKTIFAQAEHRHLTHGCGSVRVARLAPEGPARGRVLLVHGWLGQGLFMAGFAEKLVARGYEVQAIDLPAHGGSSGRRLNFPLAIEALSALARESGEAFAGIIGHSFGGAVALAAAAGGVPLFPKLGVERIVTIAAPNAMQPYGRVFSKTLGLGQRAHAAFEGEVLAVAGRPMESFNGSAYLQDLHQPTLVIHAPDDKEIPFSDAEAMAGVGAHVQLHAAPGLGHRRILFDEGVQARAAEFIAGS
ncbi:MAG: alpha/beta fold hydrolase [Proteobacteria bacterium]|nr:alpha/beta fold hydrolase [Pseudomonadota bacterium]